MKKIVKYPLWLIASLSVFFLQSCLYSNIRVPLDDDLWETKLGSKSGSSYNHSILWLVAWGDAGVRAAMENGGLKTANHMDMGIQTYFFGVYTRRETIVYGD